jgi:hypothetical protein
LESINIDELTARSSKKGVNGRFINDSVLFVAFTLNSPVFPGFGASDKVNSGVFASEVPTAREILPKPNVSKVGITRVRKEPRAH